MRIVIALGGNALLRRGEPLTAKAQARNVGVAAAALATLGRDHGLVVTHGNGPQVGLLALQDAAIPESGGFPLDVLGAESTGMIGYMVAQEFRNRLPGRQIATLLTQIEVDPRDPAFQRPTKPIGPVYEEAEARALATRRGWTIAPDGNGYRRVVPSPNPWGNVHGVEAVIEKDLSAALVAREVTADALLLLTDAEAVYTDWGTDSARPIRYATPEEIRRYSFPEGSMGPKVAAAADFVERTGGIAGIGRLRDAEAILRGRAGTLIQNKPRAGG
jgi:carbamate kinase